MNPLSNTAKCSYLQTVDTKHLITSFVSTTSLSYLSHVQWSHGVRHQEMTTNLLYWRWGGGVEPSCWKNSYSLSSRFRFQNGEIIFPKYHSDLTVSIKKTGPIILAAPTAHYAPILMSCHSTSCSLIWDICRMVPVILST